MLNEKKRAFTDIVADLKRKAEKGLNSDLRLMAVSVLHLQGPVQV